MAILDNNLVVTIKSVGRIPFIGANGPILTPILVPKIKVDALRAAGYNVEIVSQSSTVKENKKEEKPVIEEVEAVAEEDVTEDAVEEDVTEDAVEEDVTEDAVEEEATEDTNVEEDVTEDAVEEENEELYTIYSEEDVASMDRTALRKILKARGIAVKKQQTIDILRKNVLKSNPSED